MAVVPFRPASEFTPPPVSIPANFEAEQAVLGAILIVNPAFLRVAEFLKAEHFADPLHGRIYDACAALIARNEAATPVTVKTFFGTDETLRKSGIDYLAKLCNAAIHIDDVSDYARQIVDTWKRRALISYAGNVMAAAGNPEADTGADDVARMAESDLYALMTDERAHGGLESVEDAGRAAVAHVEAIWKGTASVGIRTGYRALDAIIPGMAPGDYLVLAGRPGMGKSNLALGIAAKAARAFLDEAHGLPDKAAQVAFFSLEMTKSKLALLLVGQASRVPPHRAERREINAAELDRIIEAQTRLRGLPLWFDDTPAMTPAGMRVRLQRLASRRKIGLIVADHMHIMGSDTPRRDGNEVAEITARSAALKAMAKQFNAPVLALAQLNRSVEQREDKRPQLADLRQSGAIEQDADVIMFLFREEYYLRKSQPEDGSREWSDWRTRLDNCIGKAEVHIAKQRTGPEGKAVLAFDAEFQQFRDVAL